MVNKKKTLTGILIFSLLITQISAFTLTVRAEPEENDFTSDNETSFSETADDEPSEEPDTEIFPLPEESADDEPVFDPQPDYEPQPLFPVELPDEPDTEYSFYQQEISAEEDEEFSYQPESDPFSWAHDYDENSQSEYNYYDYRYVEESSSYDYSYIYDYNSYNYYNSYVSYESYAEPYYHNYDKNDYYDEDYQDETTQTEPEESSFTPQETSIDNSELTSKDWENLKKNLNSSMVLSDGKNESGDQTIRKIKEDSDESLTNDDVGYLVWGIVLIVIGALLISAVVFFNMYLRKQQPVQKQPQTSDDNPYGDNYSDENSDSDKK